jgi:pimeloyl-ACP methyl ester carboxylesterase
VKPQHSLKQDDNFKYIEEGEGEVLLLLHGLFGALANWDEVLVKFSRKYKVVIPIMPIYEMSLLSLSVEGLANFIHKFIVYKGYSSVTLLGNSLGGHVALVYALKHPEKVTAMVLTGSSGLYENAMGGSFPKRGDKEYIKKKVEFTFYDPNTATDELVNEVYEVTADRLKVIRILALAKSAIRHNMRKDINRITVPVCLIWGLNDNITPPAVAEEFHSLFPDSEVHFLDKCGHAPMMEKPEEFNVILESFLTKVFKNNEVTRNVS